MNFIHSWYVSFLGLYVPGITHILPYQLESTLGVATLHRVHYTRQNTHVWLLAGHLEKDKNVLSYSGLPGKLIIKTL